MEHLNFYRRYRPTSFDQVIGQQTIVKTLENAIKYNKISHAYLFNGPRGTGKTSIAKIFSKEINNFNDNKDHPDIWEMDAASNNGVDEIRRIIENVSFVPIEAKYKVYIIDEVHMLSKGAFNALLKTLEDPPPYVVFILATTEVHKIPITVISRCQRFDFQRLLESEIVEEITYICQQENIEYEDQAIAKIAQLADGGMRDALSLLEKVITYDPHLTLDNVCACFNVINQAQINQLLQYMFNGEVKQTIEYFNQIYLSGIDGQRLVEDMELTIKDIIVEHHHPLLETSLKLLNELLLNINRSNNIKLTIEVYLIQIASLVDTKQAINQTNYQPLDLESLKQQLPDDEFDFNQLEYPNESKLDPKILDAQRLDINIQTGINTKCVELKEEERFKSEPIKKDEMSTIKDIDDAPTPQPSVDVVVEEEVLQQEVTPSVEETKQPVNLDDLFNASQEITLMEVLSSATKQEKVALATAFKSIKEMLESHQKFGIAKFFEKANVHACGERGCVLSLEEKDYPHFDTRVDDINTVLINAKKVPFKVFLMPYSQWEANKEYYRQKVKEQQEQNLYNIVQSKYSDVKVIRK